MVLLGTLQWALEPECRILMLILYYIILYCTMLCYTILYYTRSLWFMFPEPWEDPKSRTPNSELQYSYGVDPPRALGLYGPLGPYALPFKSLSFRAHRLVTWTGPPLSR